MGHWTFLVEAKPICNLEKAMCTSHNGDSVVVTLMMFTWKELWQVTGRYVQILGWVWKIYNRRQTDQSRCWQRITLGQMSCHACFGRSLVEKNHAILLWYCRKQILGKVTFPMIRQHIELLLDKIGVTHIENLRIHLGVDKGHTLSQPCFEAGEAQRKKFPLLGCHDLI